MEALASVLILFAVSVGAILLFVAFGVVILWGVESIISSCREIGRLFRLR